MMLQKLKLSATIDVDLSETNVLTVQEMDMIPSETAMKKSLSRREN